MMVSKSVISNYSHSYIFNDLNGLLNVNIDTLYVTKCNKLPFETYTNKKEEFNFHGPVSLDPFKMSTQK